MHGVDGHVPQIEMETHAPRRGARSFQASMVYLKVGKIRREFPELEPCQGTYINYPPQNHS